MRTRGMSWLAFALALMARLAVSESLPCDPHLLQPAGNPYGYRQRGDRCEGLYIQQVSGAPLVIASWTASFGDYDLHSRQPISIEWQGMRGAGSVRLRAQGLRRRLYYRMDTLRPSGSKSFAWQPDLLSALNISRQDVGVVGIAHGLAGEAEQEIYLPLRISHGIRPAWAGNYELVLLPGAELKEVFISLSTLNGTKRSVLKEGEALGYGYYPAERPIDIPIAGARARGLYHLEVGATLKSGGAAAAELWFYHPGD